MSLEEENAALRADNAALRAENDALRQELSTLREQVERLTTVLHAAQARIAEVEAKKTLPPAFVKANVPERPKQPRKKRAAHQNRARRLETPTQVVEHRLEGCPACQGRLSGVHLARRRQVVDLPLPPPVQVTEHQVQSPLVFVLPDLARGPAGPVFAGAGPGTHRRGDCQPGRPPASGRARPAAGHPSLVGKRACGAPLGGRDQRSAAARGRARAGSAHRGARGHSGQSGGAGR